MSSAAHSHRLPALDGIRGIALLVVIFCHTNPQVFPGGNIGVDLFFVLSGFLITSILLREITQSGDLRLWRFYKRRFYRLVPALVLMVAFVVGYAAFTEDAGRFAITLWDTLFVAIYQFNWALVWSQGTSAAHQVMYTHLWSLSIEEQFYFFWPVVLLFAAARQRPSRTLLLIMGALILWPTIGRMLIWETGPSLKLYFRSDLRFDNLMWGALAAWVLHNGYWPKDDLTQVRLGWAGFAALGLFFVMARFNLLSNGFLYMGGYTLVGIITALFILVAVTRPPAPMRAFLEARWLRWTGVISYGLYLWHIPMFKLAMTYIPETIWLQNTAALVGSYVFAIASYYLVEVHFLRMKDRMDEDPARVDMPALKTPA